MKITKIEELKNLFEEHFKQHIEGVDRCRRGEDMQADYAEEYEGPGTGYELKGQAESVDSVHTRSKERKGDYEDEYEGPDVSYEAFVKTLDETNLYHDSDKRSAGKSEDDEASSHAAPEGHLDKFPGPPEGVATESRVPSLTKVYEEGYYGIEEGSLPPWLKDKKGEKEDGDGEKEDSENPFAKKDEKDDE